MGWLAMSRTRPSARPMDIGSGERLGTETGYKAGERSPVVWRPTCSGSQAPATYATCDIASLPRARARLEPERAVEPQGTDRGHMRATVLVDGGQPGRAGIRRVRSWRRPRSELPGNCGPIHRRQPIRLTQIDDLHKASLHCPADILANSMSQTRPATTAEVIAHTRVTSRAGAHSGTSGSA